MLAVKNLQGHSESTKKAVKAAICFAWLIWTAGQLVLLIVSVPQLISGGMVVLHTGGWAEPLGVSLVSDRIFLFGSLLILITGSTSILFALGDRSISPSFFLFVFFFLAACQGILAARDLFTLFVFFEIIAIAAYILIAAKKYPRAILAGFRYLLIASVTIFFYLIAVFIIYRATGSLAIPTAGAAMALSEPERALTAAAILAGLTSRMAVFPFHGWLPEAHSQAAHPVSALLSGLLIKMPLLVMFRLVHLFSAPFLPRAPFFILISGVVTALFGAFMALNQRDAKRLLAYSSISQMGFLFAAFGAALELNGAAAAAVFAAVMLHAFSHALFKPLLFLSVGVVTDRAGSRDLLTLRGAAAGSKIWFLLFLTGAASLAGLPLMGGYISKHLLSAAFYGHGAAGALMTLAAAGSTAYILKLGSIFLPAGAPRAAEEPRDSERTGGGGTARLIPAIILALLIIAAGTVPLFAAVPPFPAAPGFKPEYLLKQLFTMAGGAALFLLSRCGATDRFTRGIRLLPLGTEAAMMAMLSGFLISFAVLL
jgi:multicomponent Na+:H+ antiporter subunit D